MAACNHDVADLVIDPNADPHDQNRPWIQIDGQRCEHIHPHSEFDREMRVRAWLDSVRRRRRLWGRTFWKTPRIGARDSCGLARWGRSDRNRNGTPRGRKHRRQPKRVARWHPGHRRFVVQRRAVRGRWWRLCARAPLVTETNNGLHRLRWSFGAPPGSCTQA